MGHCDKRYVPTSLLADSRGWLVAPVTKAAPVYYGMPRERIIALIKETPLDRVAVRGALVVDGVGGPAKE